MAKGIFYDPERKRWKRLRLVFDLLAVVVTVSIIVFVVTVLRGENLPGLLLPQQKRPYHALKEKERRRSLHRAASRRRTRSAPSQVVLNADEGIRAAFYVNWDAGSFASLKEYVHQIDLLFPEWVHVLTPDGRAQAVTAENRLFDIIHGPEIRPIDDKVMSWLKAENAETEVFPLVNNYQPQTRQWVNIEGFLNDPGARANFRRQVVLLLGSDKYHGLSVDFEGFPAAAQPGYRALIAELYADLHRRGLKLYVNVPPADDDYDYRYLAANADGLVLMNYDQHSVTSPVAGPVAAQDWFMGNVRETLKLVPRDKLICAIGNYGYDWAESRGKKKAAAVDGVSVQEAWLHAQESEEDIEFDPDSLNPHYAYSDDANQRHDVWFLDAVTALNQMRAAEHLGISTFALWRLGAEDRSLWAVWDVPGEKVAPDRLRRVPPGQDVDMEGHGEIMRIAHRPAPGQRDVTLDAASGLITGESFTAMPTPYQIDQYGASRDQIALTFDDGPDPNFTPEILDILKQKNVRATFFLIGTQAEKFSTLVKRIYNEGHEIGNHTWTHPDISNISRRFMTVEMNLAESFFAAKLGVKPLYFRPPYSIDQEPDTADQVRPLEITQDMGYVAVGNKLDPNDWKENPRRSAEQITESVLYQLDHSLLGGPCPQPGYPCGNIVLLHDGGGDRRETVRALPMIIDQLRARGYHLVGVSELVGKQRADVMPPISSNERWAAQVNSFVFSLYGGINFAILVVFFLGDILMTARLFLVGGLAIFDRFRQRMGGLKGSILYWPSVAILVPAYNEEKMIVSTVRAALASTYPRLRVIVVDDGSSDATYEVTRQAFAQEIAAGRVLMLSKPNAGKAEALNFGLAHVEEEIFVGIDADTIIAPEALSRLIRHFVNPRMAAVAGNTKVGNRVNIWTRWQALEYITSQNFERRALNVFSAVSVVPGAIGAWRTAAVRAAGGFHPDTVAEDADLTMSLLEHGGLVEYEDRALAYTEAPTTARALMRQRFRWSFGILQAVWKHRRAFARKGTLGWLALPNIAIFQILLPLVSPFIDLMFVAGALSYVTNRYFHPDTANPADFLRLVIFFSVFLMVDLIASVIAFSLERREPGKREDVWLLAHVWLQRFAYRQLFSIVLLKTLKRAIDGQQFSWDKLERAAAVPQART